MANRKPYTRRLKAAGMLLLCVMLSAAMLFSRLVSYTKADTRQYIPLTRSNGITTVLVDGEDGTFVRAEGFNPNRPVLLAAEPVRMADWFRVTDKDTVWKGNTQVEIFRASYANGESQITVKSSDGDKLIAPGTENSYTFALENTADGPVAYSMSMKAYLSSDDHTIPVVAKVRRETDHAYFLGSAGEYKDVLQLNQVKDSGTLKKGYVMPYTLSWQWPFEGDDAYDTLLGNLEEDLTLTIVIETYAEYAPPSADGGIPKTGDTSHIGLWFTVMLGSAAGLMFLLLLMRRKGEENETV